MDSPSISMRAVAAIAALSALFCLAAASASAAPLVWAPNATEGTVSTFNSATKAEVGSPIDVVAGADSIALTPSGRQAFVTGPGEEVTEIETATRRPVSIRIDGFGGQVAGSPDGTEAWVASVGGPEIFTIDVGSRAVRTLSLGAEATALAFSPSGELAYVGTRAGTVEVIDTATRKPVGPPIDVSNAPSAIAFTPDGDDAFVAVPEAEEVVVVGVSASKRVGTIPLTGEPSGVAVAPDGRDLYVTERDEGEVSVFETGGTRRGVGGPIAVGAEPREIAIAPNGKTAWVASDTAVTPVDLLAEEAEPPVGTGGAAALAIAPDQSPTPSFTAPNNVIAGTPAAFSGSASIDPDGSIAAWNWAFGDGGTAAGVSTSHTFKAPGTYTAKLSVVDNEGCGEELVFTGRTAYCSGAAPAVHAVVVKAPAAVPIAAPEPPSNRFRLGRLVHNRRNGTARLQVKLPSAGFVLLFGKKVHAVTRKSKGVQSMWLTLHARVELNKRLKKIHRALVPVRITFTPNGGTPRTVHQTFALLRAPRKTRSRN